MPRVNVYLPREEAARLEELRRLWRERKAEEFPLSEMIRVLIRAQPDPRPR